VLATQHYARPAYTRRCLEALAACRGIASCLVLAHVDLAPDPAVRRAVVEALQGFAACPIRIVRNPRWLGCEPTAIAGLDAAALEADYFVHLDEDSVLAPDALQFYAWARDRYRADPAVGSAAAYHVRRAPVDPADHHAVVRLAGFGSSAMATWADRYRAARPTICAATLTDPVRVATIAGAGPIPAGWDAGFWRHFRAHGQVQVLPVLSRCQNIGVCSSIHPPTDFFTPEWHAANQHCPHWAGDGRAIAPGAWHEVDHA
jgi:hypothetical protein